MTDVLPPRSSASSDTGDEKVDLTADESPSSELPARRSFFRGTLWQATVVGCVAALASRRTRPAESSLILL